MLVVLGQQGEVCIEQLNLVLDVRHRSLERSEVRKRDTDKGVQPVQDFPRPAVRIGRITEMGVQARKLFIALDQLLHFLMVPE